MNIKQALEEAAEQQVAFMPMMIPMPIFKLLNDVAIKEGKTVAMLITETLREKVEALGKKYPREGV